MARARQRRRGYLEQLQSGSVRAVVFAGKDPLTGRLRYIRETCKTVGEAEAALTKLLRLGGNRLHRSEEERWGLQQRQVEPMTRVG
jgi:hypothetical protein